MGNGELFVFCFVLFCFVLRTTSVSPLDRDKDTLSLTRKNANAFFRLRGVEIWWALSGSWGEEAVYLNSKMQLFFEFTEEVDMVGPAGLEPATR